MREARADAPGCVNLIGEHTEYHDGFVMPCVVPQRARVTLRLRQDDRVRGMSRERPDAILEFRLGDERRTGEWIDYVQGLTWALRAGGHALSGFDLEVASDVPIGSGLSSSAALEVAVLRGARALFGLQLDDPQIAALGRSAELEFVGIPVGIMNQMAASLAGEQEALFLDTRSQMHQRIPLPAGLDLVVINSGIAQPPAGDGQMTRRAESEEAARLLGVSRLREIGTETLRRVEELPPLLARRARHVVTENARVLAARSSLKSGDLRTFGHLLAESHKSLRMDYEASVAEIDTLVDLATSTPRVFGARMTGSGFGGAIVAAVEKGAAREVASRVIDKYARLTQRSATVLVPQP